MTIVQAKNITVGIVTTCSRRGPDLEPSITAEIAYYTHDHLLHRTANESTYCAPPPPIFYYAPPPIAIKGNRLTLSTGAASVQSGRSQVGNSLNREALA